jgi:membrane dipeptidase
VTAEHARMVAGTRGVIGIFPVNSGGYHGLPGYVDHIERMIEAVGIDHVGIGTDMDGISPSSFVAIVDYGDWSSVTSTLLARGYAREDVAKVAGGNFLRVYREVATA